MKMMRTSTLCVAALLCGTALAATAVAQDAPPPPQQDHGQWQGGPGGPGGRGPGPERRLEMLQHRLNLTPDQTTQIKAIFEDGRTKMEALRSNSALAPQDRRTQGEALRKDETAKVESVLTPDQKTKFEEMEAKQREQMRDHRGPGGDSTPPPPPPPPSM